MAAPFASSTATNLELTTAWNVNAAYEHFWSPRWRTSVYGGYAAVSYDTGANNLLDSGDASVAAPAGSDMD
jgi:hypothetical protein